MVTLDSTVSGDGKSNTGLIVAALLLAAAAGYYVLVYND